MILTSCSPAASNNARAFRQLGESPRVQTDGPDFDVITKLTRQLDHGLRPIQGVIGVDQQGGLRELP